MFIQPHLVTNCKNAWHIEVKEHILSPHILSMAFLLLEQLKTITPNQFISKPTQCRPSQPSQIQHSSNKPNPISPNPSNRNPIQHNLIAMQSNPNWTSEYNPLETNSIQLSLIQLNPSQSNPIQAAQSDRTQADCNPSHPDAGLSCQTIPTHTYAIATNLSWGNPVRCNHIKLQLVEGYSNRTQILSYRSRLAHLGYQI